MKIYMAVTKGTVITYTATLANMASDSNTKKNSHCGNKNNSYNSGHYTGDQSQRT